MTTLRIHPDLSCTSINCWILSSTRSTVEHQIRARFQRWFESVGDGQLNLAAREEHQLISVNCRLFGPEIASFLRENGTGHGPTKPNTTVG